jgi:hypothetical protein
MSWLPVQGVLPTVPDQETEETQPYAPKREQTPKCGSNEEEKKPFKATHFKKPTESSFSTLSILVNAYNYKLSLISISTEMNDSAIKLHSQK